MKTKFTLCLVFFLTGCFQYDNVSFDEELPSGKYTLNNGEKSAVEVVDIQGKHFVKYHDNPNDGADGKIGCIRSGEYMFCDLSMFTVFNSKTLVRLHEHEGSYNISFLDTTKAQTKADAMGLGSKTNDTNPMTITADQSDFVDFLNNEADIWTQSLPSRGYNNVTMQIVERW